MKRSLSLTVGIPTCYGGKSLVRVIKSLRASQELVAFQCLVVADSIPIPISIKNELKSLLVDLTENKIPGSQISKVKQIVDQTKTDIFVFTQDDVRFTPEALYEIQKTFIENPEVTMVAAKILPEPPASLFERIIGVGLSIVTNVASTWNRGNNYLSANGRCLAFRTQHLKQMRIPDKLVNTDAYLYFENARAGGTFMVAEKAIVYNPNPTSLSEQLRQTERFLYSKRELTLYFGHLLDLHYRIPRQVFVRAILTTFFTNPIYFLLYVGVYLLGNLKITFFPKDLTPMWKVNLSTKLDSE